MKVRPLGRSERERWTGLAGALSLPPEDPAALEAEMAEEDERCFLIALDEGECVARMRGRFLNSELFLIREMRVADGLDMSVARKAFASFLLASFSGDRTEILSSDREEFRATNAALKEAGFVVGREKAFVAREIAGYRSPYVDGCAYRTLAEIGEDRFVEIMTEASRGDPFEDAVTRDPMRDFRDLIDYAGEMFDPTWWRVAFLEGAPAGVVLPQAFTGSTREGTLFYVGVLEDFRGQGLGRTLHAGGLEFLADRGITRYVGSTDRRNLPMLAVFAANGCQQTRTQFFYKPLRRDRSGHDATRTREDT